MSLKTFQQHGWTLQDARDGSNPRGTCPFCGKHKMFVNEKNGMWDCKVCGKSGSRTTFLTEITEKNLTNAQSHPEALEFLGEIRGLKEETLIAWKIGINASTAEYSVPYFTGKDYKAVSNIKRYDPVKKLFMATTGSVPELFGLWKIPKEYRRVWVCEGEWDALALWESLQITGRENEAVISLPGASQWKPLWLNYFKGKEVFCCFDNDDAGQKGAVKFQSKVEKHVRALFFINWPDGTADKYDLRDYRNTFPSDAHGTEFLDKLEGLFRNTIKDEEKYNPNLKNTTKTGESERESSGVVYDGEFVPPEEVYATYRRWLHLPKSEVIDVLYGTVLANRLQGDPVWLFLVAPSGGTKSELLMSLNEAHEIHSTTTLTASSLISGMNLGENDPSLIPRLDGKVLIVKDFTTILNMPAMARDEIFGILRDAYDGKIEKMFGNGVTREYTSLFGVLAGTTPAIEIYAEEYVALGERFLRWREPLPTDSTELVFRALMNSNKETNMREELSHIGAKVLSYNYPTNVSINEETAYKLVALAQWVAMMRGTVNRDRYSKEITHSPFQEVGTRLAKQFTKLGMGISMFKGVDTISPEVVTILLRTAYYTVSSKLTGALKSLLNRDGTGSPRELADDSGLPIGTVKRVMEDLVALGAVKRTGLEEKPADTKAKAKPVTRKLPSLSIGSSDSTSYTISKDCMDLMVKSGLMKLIGRVL